jgi:heme/copper-type cytochrome/quinol oxidase subunit 1
MADVATHANPNVLQTLNIFSEDVNGFGAAATALMMGATSLAILRSRALPSWLAYVGLVLAVASFAIPLLGLPGVGLWVLLTTFVVLVASRTPKVTGQLQTSV